MPPKNSQNNRERIALTDAPMRLKRRKPPPDIDKPDMLSVPRQESLSQPIRKTHLDSSVNQTMNR
eukprot:5534604-Amphidinium_carterae.1